jgi:hypothetical protein
MHHSVRGEDRTGALHSLTLHPWRSYQAIVWCDSRKAAPTCQPQIPIHLAAATASAYARPRGRCFRAVDPISETPPKLIAIDEETDHEIVHGRRFGKADRAPHETFDPRPEVNVFACDLLRVLFADHVLCRVDMALVSTPPSV